MKKSASLILVILTLFMLSLSSCGQVENDSNSVSNDTATSGESTTFSVGSLPDASSQAGTSDNSGTTGESSTVPQSEGSGATSKPNSGGDASKPDNSTSKPETSTPANSDTSNSPSTGNTNPGSNIQYTDGNIYTLTDDLHFIIKIDASFKGYEILYEGKYTEILHQPTYCNGAVYFLRESYDEPDKIYRVDVNTKKQTTVFSGSQIPDFSGEWSIVGSHIFLKSHASGDKITYYMCNLDGGNLKKTSAVDVYSLSLLSNEYNGKVYIVGGYSTSFNAIFYEMNIDGTGFKKLFTKNHSLCNFFELLGVLDGEIYYNANTTRDETTTDGFYKVKLDGSGQKRIQRATLFWAATDGKSLYCLASDDIMGISRVEKNDTISKGVALKGENLYSLKHMHNGFMYVEGDRGYIMSLPGLKVYKVADYSPPSPFKNYKDGLNILSLPTKTNYKVGEGFDTTGFKHVYYNKYAGTLTEISDRITFVTNGVTLTQGRPFTTGGTKEIQIRYLGDVVATYTITVIDEKNPSNYSTGVNILSYPTKTTYKVGEGFDITGLNAVYYADGKATDIKDKLTFFTSNTVELTQGRPFTTAGTKVVEIRYNGKKVATFTITVKK